MTHKVKIHNKKVVFQFDDEDEFYDCSIEQVTVEQATVKQVTAEQDKQVIVNKLNENVQELKKRRGRPAFNKKALIVDVNTTKKQQKNG